MRIRRGFEPRKMLSSRVFCCRGCGTDASRTYDARHLALWDLALTLMRWRGSSGSWLTTRLDISTS